MYLQLQTILLIILKNIKTEMIKRFDLKSGHLVSDIGSNDGTTLSF